MEDALQATEALGAAGATGPRVSLDMINQAIVGENTFNVGKALRALGQPTTQAADLLTVCVLTLHNGYTIVGKSSPASPENFDADKGATFAREDAVRQAWPLLAFALRDQLAIRPAFDFSDAKAREPA